jgi:hypothetical protein
VLSTTPLSVGRYLVVIDDGVRRVGIPVAIINP